MKILSMVHALSLSSMNEHMNMYVKLLKKTRSRVLSHDLFYFINFASQAGRVPQQLAPITVAPFFTLPTMIRNRRQTTTQGTTCPTLSDKCVGSFTSRRIINIEGL